MKFDLLTSLSLVPVLFWTDVSAICESDCVRGSIVEGERDFLVGVDGAALVERVVDVVAAVLTASSSLDLNDSCELISYIWPKIFGGGGYLGKIWGGGPGRGPKNYSRFLKILRVGQKKI